MDDVELEEARAWYSQRKKYYNCFCFGPPCDQCKPYVEWFSSKSSAVQDRLREHFKELNREENRGVLDG